jgi:hypothetical protein
MTLLWIWPVPQHTEPVGEWPLGDGIEKSSGVHKVIWFCTWSAGSTDSKIVDAQLVVLVRGWVHSYGRGTTKRRRVTLSSPALILGFGRMNK